MKSTITMLEILMPVGDRKEPIHPVVIEIHRDKILVDCGFIGSLPLIEAALHQHKINPNNITAVVLTHHDHDHMGAAAAFKKKYPKALFYASALEEPYISATEKPLRLVQSEEMLETMPVEEQEYGRAFSSLLRSVEPVEIDVLLQSNDELLESGYRVVATPGHTPGHISLYNKESSTIVAGDAMVLENTEPAVANPQFALDLGLATASLEKLLCLGAKTIICHHGGRYIP